MITKIQATDFKRTSYNKDYLSQKSKQQAFSKTLPSTSYNPAMLQNYYVSFTGLFDWINKTPSNPFANTYKEISSPAAEVIDAAKETAQHFGHKEVNHYHIMYTAVIDTLDFIEQYENGEVDLEDATQESGPGYFKEYYTHKLFENDEYREKFKVVLNETLETLEEILSDMPPSKTNNPKFSDNLKKDIIHEKSSTTLADESIPILDGYDIFIGTFGSNIKDVKNFVKEFDMKIYDIYQLEDLSKDERIHFKNYDKKAELVMKNLNKGTNMFITYDSTKIEPNSFVPSLREAFQHSTGKFNPNNTEIIEFSKNVYQCYLYDKINALKKDKNKNYIVIFSQQNVIENSDITITSSIRTGLDDEYLDIFKKTPKNVALIVFDTKDSYLTALSNDLLFKAFKDTAEISIPVLTKEDVYNALKQDKFIKEKDISICDKALEKVVETSTQMEGKFPEKTIDLLKKVSQHIDKEEITLKDVSEFVKESEYLFKKTGNESSVDIIFNTGKTLDDMVGKYNTKKEAENIIKQIKDDTLGTKGFIIYSQDGSVGSGRRHTAEVIAGEAKIPFVSINTLDFGTKDVDIFGGGSMSPEASIKKLFSLVSTQAETNSHKSAVLFIENFEYFSIGEMVSEYHQKAMAQLIREMTTAQRKGLNIVVMGSVSDPSLLGEAATKSFKFNDNIEVSSPMINRGEREEILRHMINESDIKLAGTSEENEKLIETLAKTLSGFSFIDLKKFVQKSDAIAQERGHKKVEKEDMIESYLRLTTGRPNVSNIPEHEKFLTTKHECGHAVTLQVMNDLMHKAGKQWMLPNTVNFITLDPRAFYGGAMYNVSDSNAEHCFENQFISIVCCYGGHSSEKHFYDMDGSWGITCDLDQATSTAESMVTAMGMGYNTGKISLANMYGEEDFERNITPRLRSKIEKDVEVITKNALLASDMIVEYYEGFINKFADKYASKVGTGECLIDGDQFRKELAEWKAQQSPEKQAELELLDNLLLDIIKDTKKGKLY